MKGTKRVIALSVCLLTIALSGCGTAVSAQTQRESSLKPVASIQNYNGVAVREDTGMNDTQKTIYDDLDLSIFDLSRYDNAKYMQYYWDICWALPPSRWSAAVRPLPRWLKSPPRLCVPVWRP